MNNIKTALIVSWQTRSWRHNKKAILWCKNYGLKPILKNVYTGKVYAKEKAAILTKFKTTFIKKSEKFLLHSSCQSCFETVFFSDKLLEVSEELKANTTFEIIQIGTDLLKTDKKPYK